MGMLSDFKAFALKGNVVDLAVAVIIGGAFSGIVKSLVGDVIMPLVGAVFGNVDFSNLYLPLASVPPGTPETLEGMKAAAVPVLAWGSFVTVLVNFIILAFVIFLMVRQVNKLMSAFEKKEAEKPAEPPPTPEEILLLREIRDSLAKKAD